jgi:hypothetical protein
VISAADPARLKVGLRAKNDNWQKRLAIGSIVNDTPASPD